MDIKIRDNNFYIEKIVEEEVSDEYVLEQYKAGMDKYSINKQRLLEIETEKDTIVQEQDKINPILTSMEQLLKQKGLILQEDHEELNKQLEEE